MPRDQELDSPAQASRQGRLIRPARLILADSFHRLRRFGPVQLRVNLRHDRGGMAQHGPGHVQAELPTEPSRRVVAELVGVPVRDRSWNVKPGLPRSPLGPRVGLADAVLDRLAVSAGSVPRPRSLSGFTPPPILLGGLDPGFSALPLSSVTLGLRFGRREQVGRQLGPEPRPENRLGRRAEIDPTLPVVMLRLMALGSVGLGCPV